MSAFDENDCAYYHSPLRSLSTMCSIETADNLESLLQSHCGKVHLPEDHRLLFEIPNEQQSETYNKTFWQVQNVIQELQNTLPPVCIKDECSIQPKPVVLRIPMKRNTIR